MPRIHTNAHFPKDCCQSTWLIKTTKGLITGDISAMGLAAAQWCWGVSENTDPIWIPELWCAESRLSFKIHILKETGIPATLAISLRCRLETSLKKSLQFWIPHDTKVWLWLWSLQLGAASTLECVLLFPLSYCWTGDASVLDAALDWLVQFLQSCQIPCQTAGMTVL